MLIYNNLICLKGETELVSKITLCLKNETSYMFVY